MRFVVRTLMFAIVILVSFWFTAENADEIVSIDLAFLRIRTSLPLVIFVSLLSGMAASTLIGWRAERKAARGAAPPSQLGGGQADHESYEYFDSASVPEEEPLERSPLS